MLLFPPTLSIIFYIQKNIRYYVLSLSLSLSLSLPNISVSLSLLSSALSSLHSSASFAFLSSQLPTQMKKLIMKLDLHDDKDKRKALKIVSALPGIDSISMDMKDMKLTVIGTVDPVTVVTRLRKFWKTNIIIVGPAKEPEKKEEPKKEEPKKEEPAKKEEPKKEEPKKEGEEPKKDEPKKKEPEPVPAMGIMPYRPYYPPINTYYYAHHSVEENPNGCVIS